MSPVNIIVNRNENSAVGKEYRSLVSTAGIILIHWSRKELPLEGTDIKKYSFLALIINLSERSIFLPTFYTARFFKRTLLSIL